jgi:hypothetical protein
MTNIISIVSDTKNVQIVITVNAIWATGLTLLLLGFLFYKFVICEDK